MRVLIANRGEIALRIIRAIRELGGVAIAIYAPEEKYAPYVKAADEAYELSSPRSFIDVRELVEIAVKSRADAVHPGYGFLSENPIFAQALLDEGIIRIGPPPKVLELLGDKVAAKRVAIGAGVPTLPATLEPVRSLDEALKSAERIGYPVVVKAVGGGGGMGIRVARSEEELMIAREIAAKEARQAFGDERVFIEKYVDKPRHIEVQIIADDSGTYHLYERDCSVQRKFQKIIEEAPSPALDAESRERVAEYAIRMAEAVGFRNAGTVEFLYKDGSFYFLEVNPRLQVEHGVTELVTGIDIVKEQLRVAFEGEVSFEQSDVSLRGHAIEARIYAEDPFGGFVPSRGIITNYKPPSGPGIRVDDGVEPGYVIPEYYNALIAKVIARGRDRNEAISRLSRALKEAIVSGVKTNVPLLLAILSDEEFLAGRVYTRYLEDRLSEITDRMLEEYLKNLAAIAAAMTYRPKKERLERSIVGKLFARLHDIRRRRPMRREVEINGFKATIELKDGKGFVDFGTHKFDVDISRISPDEFVVSVSGEPRRVRFVDEYTAFVGGRFISFTYIERPPIKRPDGRPIGAEVTIRKDELPSPLAGRVVEVLVKNGSRVRKGQPIVVLESMKMLIEVRSDRDGEIERVLVERGEVVSKGQPLVRFASEEPKKRAFTLFIRTPSSSHEGYSITRRRARILARKAG